MKAYVQDFNNILRGIKERVNLTSNPHEADIFILWQDVRGGMKTLCDINKNYIGKPVVVVQHGRGATRDYNAPNNFPLLANKICVWGEAEFERMERAGYGDKTIITGSPLASLMRNVKKDDYCEKTIVYSPVIAAHEEAFNLEVYYELKKIEYEYSKRFLKKYEKRLKMGWHAYLIDETVATEGSIPYDLIRKDFFVVAKLTDIHDQKLYHGVSVKTNVCNVAHLENTIKVLQNTSMLVGVEEGTMQLMASYLDIPTLIVDGFEYGNYGGVEDYKTELIRSDATAFCTIDKLQETIEYELENKEKRQEARREVIRREFDPFPDKDPIETIIDVASNVLGSDIRKEEYYGQRVNC